MITPLYASYNESNISAESGAEASPDGAGILVTICSRTSSILIPFLADISGASFRCKQKKQRSFAPGDGRSERCAYLIIFRLCGI